MACYLVCYDVGDPQTYPALWALLESWGSVRLLESVWAVDAELSALEIRNALKEVIGGDDGLAIVEVRTQSWWACENAEPEGLDWLRRKILA
jgi:CRISPR/Cas system-associated endoribonuclease Cas2